MIEIKDKIIERIDENTVVGLGSVRMTVEHCVIHVLDVSTICFHGFFDFFDCHFEKQLTVENNIFIKGTDLVLRENKGFDNYFHGGVVLSGNIGNLNIWP